MVVVAGRCPNRDEARISGWPPVTFASRSDIHPTTATVTRKVAEMSEELDVRLRESAPAVHCVEYTATVSAMLDDVTSGGRLRRLPLSWPGLAAAVAAAVLVPSAAVAAVARFTAETGEYGPAVTTETDTSQYIDLCAPDIREYLAANTPTGVALPAGASWAAIADRFLASVQQDCRPGGLGVTTQETGIAGFLLSGASCLWAAEFVEADRQGSADGMKDAADALARVLDASAATRKDSAAAANRDRATRGDAAWITQRHEQCQPAPVSGAADSQP
jgi:hypothetical protein